MRANNLTLLTDLYELTMMQGYFKNPTNQTVIFDMFYRNNPNGGGFAICAGLEQMIEYIENLRFTEEDITYLRSLGIFEEDFLEYLSSFKFTGDIYAIPEGTVIFPREPMVKVIAPIMEAQLVETAILNIMNHQSLIATKANRIVRAAQGRAVMEFGSRRAQGADGAVMGSRAAYIGGCVGTACTLSDRDFKIPALGTMAHSWVQLFDSELEAFRAYAKAYPTNCLLLVDTYNVLKSGVPNAIRVFDEVLKPLGMRPAGIRIDSGDITYLSCKARKMLDEAGYPDCKICASNSLDEYIIRDMIMQGAQVDTFGVGERLITASSEPVMGGVYKLSAIEHPDGTVIPKIKISENVSKITNPCFKGLWRLFDRESDKAIADVITLADEIIDDTRSYDIFDPEHVWKRKTVENFHAEPMRVKLFEHGKKVYHSPELSQIRAFCEKEVDRLWTEVKRFENPHHYYVDLSPRLWNEKNRLLSEHSF